MPEKKAGQKTKATGSRCPSCGKPASGKFCSECGASLNEDQLCAGCGNQIPRGGRFCNMCGVPVTVGAAAGKRISPVIYAAFGSAVLVGAVVAFLVLQDRTPEPSVPVAPPLAGPALDPASIDISAMTPREAADRLFGRVMDYVAAGDRNNARTFTPMALAAYQRVDDLDLYGHYRVAVLHLVNDDPQAARAEADAILQEVPTHLFGLYTAAQAEEMMGNSGEAASLYGSFLEQYDSEIASGRREYQDNARVLPAMREDAMRPRAPA